MYYNKLKEIRLEKGMTLKELAEKANISAGYLCRGDLRQPRDPCGSFHAPADQEDQRRGEDHTHFRCLRR